MWVILSLGSALFSGTAWVLSKGASSADAKGAIALRSFSLLLFTLLYTATFGSLDTFIAIDKRALWSSVGAGLTAAFGLVCFQRLIEHGLGRGAMLEKLSILVIALAEWCLGDFRLSVWGICGLLLILVGITIMSASRSISVDNSERNGDVLLIVGTVVFTSASSLLAKWAVGGVPAEIALSYRTGIVMLAVVIWLISTRSLDRIRRIPSHQRWMLMASGVSAGVAWLCYYFALTDGAASAVHGLDKLSVLITTLGGAVFFGERLSRRMTMGIVVMVSGILLWSIANYS